MNNQLLPPDDDFGPDPIDRGSEKQMGPSPGGSSDIDPSYEDALRILGREHKIPSPFEQRALFMDDAEAASLARLLSDLRRSSGAGLSFLGNSIPGEATLGETAERFIASLQERPTDLEKMARLRGILESAGGEVQRALALVLDQPVVSAKLASSDSET